MLKYLYTKACGSSAGLKRKVGKDMKKYTKKLCGLLMAGAVAAGTVSAAAMTAEAANNDISDYTAAEICSDMGIGWNLGNSLDSTGSSGLNTETSWGNPKTTKAMIDAVKAKGFNCVRIPVTWYKHMDSNYTIDEVWFERVQEVVDYCIDDGMYVILNSHHDEWNRPTDANYSAASKELKIVWKQIATRFEDYDKHLVFEGMNEPRNYSGSHEWDGGDDAMRAVVNKLNADFVSAVRSTGGNNSDRALMVPTYAASMEYAAMSALELPDDDNLIVSIHAYSPYNFTMNTGSGSTSTYTDAMRSELEAIFKNISNVFISKGIPVCIGEFSSSNKNNLSERVKWAEHYAACAKKLGISCVLWDNNVINYTSNGESHGYLNRSNCTWYSQSEAVVNKLISTYNSTKTELPEIVKVPDLSKAKCTTISNTTSNISGYNATSGVRFDFPNMSTKGYIAVKYTAASAPTLILQDSSWKVWCKVTPTIAENGVAYYSYKDIVAAYEASYQSTHGSKPASALYNAVQLCVSAEGGSATIKEIIYAIVETSTSTKISDCTVTISSTGAGYTGEEIKPSFTVKSGSKTLTAGTDYTYEYKNNIKAGTAQIVITGKGSYTGSVTKNFTIAARTLNNCTVTLAYNSSYFRGTRVKPAVTVKIGDKVVDPSNYTLSYTDNLMVGTAKVTVTGKNNLSGSTVKAYQIIQRSVGNCDITLGTTSAYFSGSRIKPSVKISCNGMDLYSGNYTVEYKNNLSSGTATVTITGKKNLKGTAVRTFKILPRSIKNCTVELVADPANPEKPAVEVYCNGTKLYSGNYTVKYSANTNGTVKVTVTGKSNLKDTVTLNYTV